MAQTELVLVCCFLLSLTVAGQNFSSDEQFWERPMPWYQAYLSCHQADLALPVPMATDFSDLDPWLPGDGSWVWVGGRYVHTSWAWADDGCGAIRGAGCVTLSQLSPFISQRLTTPAHSPVDCLPLCQSGVVALQGSVCHCLTSLPATAVDQSHCSYRCEDNFDFSCGGLRYYSLYTWHPGPIPWDSNVTTMQGECAYLYLPIMQSPSAQDLRLRSGDCNPLLSGGYKSYLCQECSPPQQTCTVTRHPGYSSWTQASDHCRGQGARLLHPSDNQSLPLRYHAYVSESYWVGLSREFVLKWINGLRDLSRKIRRQDGLCLAARKDDHSEIQLIAINCDSELPFLCDQAPRADAVKFTSSSDLPPSCDTVTSVPTSQQPTDVTKTSPDTPHPHNVTTPPSTDDTITRTLFPETSPTKTDSSETTAKTFVTTISEHSSSSTVSMDVSTNTHTTTTSSPQHSTSVNAFTHTTTSSPQHSTSVNAFTHTTDQQTPSIYPSLQTSANSQHATGTNPSSNYPKTTSGSVSVVTSAGGDVTASSVLTSQSAGGHTSSVRESSVAPNTGSGTSTILESTTRPSTSSHNTVSPQLSPTTTITTTTTTTRKTPPPLSHPEASSSTSGQVTNHVSTQFPRATVLPTRNDVDTPDTDLTPLYITLGVLAGVFLMAAIAITSYCFCRSERRVKGGDEWREGSPARGDTLPARSLRSVRSPLASRLRSERTVSMDPLFRFVEHPQH